MGQLIFIHVDEIEPVFGDGIELSDSDNPSRRNISAFWESDIDGNLKNSISGGDIIKYRNNIFTTPKPVKIVVNSGDISYVNLASVNSAYSPTPNSIKSSVAGGRLVSNNSFFASMFGWINDTAKKSDGTDASNDTEAEYFELILLCETIKQPFRILGINYDIVNRPEQSGNGDIYQAWGGFCLIGNNGGFKADNLEGSPSKILRVDGVEKRSVGERIGKTYQADMLNLKSGFYSDSTWVNNFTGDFINGHTLSYEIGLSGVAIIDRTNLSKYEDANSGIIGNLSSTTMVAPMLIVCQESANNYSIDNLGLIGLNHKMI